MIWNDFCASVKHFANPSTAGPNNPIRESRMVTFSASWVSFKSSQRWGSSTTKLSMALLITCTIDLVAHRARLVAVRSSLEASLIGPDVGSYSFVGSVPTYSAVALRASRVRVPTRGPFLILSPYLSPTLLPISYDLSYCNKGENAKT